MTKSGAKLTPFDSRDVMTVSLADLIKTRIEEAIASKGRASLALSGGSTPLHLYQTLAGMDLPWASISITLVDERWVPESHERSNEAFVRGAFRAAKGAKIVGLYNSAASPGHALEDIERRIQENGDDFDVVVLGMGDDGHTASWFPNAQGLARALEDGAAVCAVSATPSEITGAETERLTLTLSAIRKAPTIVLMITGASKRRVFEAALAGGPVEDLPVRAILEARPDLLAAWSP